MAKHLSQFSIIPSGIDLQQITKFSVSAVILNELDQTLMMLRDDYPVWVNIGGNLDDGEDFETALKREIYEEINANVSIINFGGDYFSPLSKSPPYTYRHEKIFLCRLANNMKPSLGDEGICLQWFEKNDLPKNIPPRYLVRILETLNNSHTKTQILTSVGMSEFIRNLPIDKIYGLEKWISHPKVIEKKLSRKLDYWPDRA